MVKYSVCKAKLSYGCKNLLGVDTVLKIDKQGRSVVVTLEQKIGASLYTSAAQLTLTVLLLILINFAFNSTELTSFSTAVFLVGILYQFVGVVREESLIMVHSLGYQVTSKYIVGQKNLFIPWNQVQSIFINEVIIRHKVIHLLVILTKERDGEKLIPLFLELQPRLKQLELICRHLKGVNS